MIFSILIPQSYFWECRQQLMYSYRQVGTLFVAPVIPVSKSQYWNIIPYLLNTKLEWGVSIQYLQWENVCHKQFENFSPLRNTIIYFSQGHIISNFENFCLPLINLQIGTPFKMKLSKQKTHYSVFSILFDVLKITERTGTLSPIKPQ